MAPNYQKMSSVLTHCQAGYFPIPSHSQHFPDLHAILVILFFFDMIWYVYWPILTHIDPLQSWCKLTPWDSQGQCVGKTSASSCKQSDLHVLILIATLRELSGLWGICLLNIISMDNVYSTKPEAPFLAALPLKARFYLIGWPMAHGDHRWPLFSNVLSLAFRAPIILRASSNIFEHWLLVGFLCWTFTDRISALDTVPNLSIPLTNRPFCFKATTLQTVQCDSWHFPTSGMEYH